VNANPSTSSAASRIARGGPVDYAAMLGSLGAKDHATLERHVGLEPVRPRVAGVNGSGVLNIDTMNGKTPDQERNALYTDFTGWNRRAVRIRLPAEATYAQIRAVGWLCAIAARQWMLNTRR
jgi:hypothetical protein